MKILATTDGSSAAQAVIPLVRQLAAACGAEVTLLTVVERPAATPGPRSGIGRVVPGGQMGATSVMAMNAEAVLQPGPMRWAESPDQAIARVEAEAQDALREVAAPLEAAGVTVTGKVMMDADIPAAIIKAAREGEFDLIAMSTHGRTGLREVVQGSVAAAVVKSGAAPVVLVRPRA